MRRRPFWLLPLQHVNPWWWLPVAVAVMGADHMIGYALLPQVYAIPVIAAAWWSGLVPAIALAIGLPTTRLMFPAEGYGEYAVGRYVLRLCTLVLLALIADRLRRQEREREERIAALERLLPMCMYCKSIRGTDDQWQRLERYMSEAGARLSHGICPTCEKQHGWGADAS